MKEKKAGSSKSEPGCVNPVRARTANPDALRNTPVYPQAEGERFRTMAVTMALVAVSMLGVGAAHAQGEAVDLVRAGTIGGPVQNSLIGSGFVIILIGPPEPGSSSFQAAGPWVALTDPW